jgi:hypothetical protein
LSDLIPTHACHLDLSSLQSKRRRRRDEEALFDAALYHPDDTSHPYHFPDAAATLRWALRLIETTANERNLSAIAARNFIAVAAA